MGILLLLIVSCYSSLSFSLEKLPENDVVEVFVIGKPVKKASWKENPDIRVCATSEIDLYRVRSATRFWEKLGYDFGNIYTDFSPLCMNPRYGEITITLPAGDMGANNMAATKLYTEKSTGHIAKAMISIYPKYERKERVLEHEIGHALGWSHYNKKFHIMNPSWQEGGYDHVGLRKR